MGRAGLPAGLKEAQFFQTDEKGLRRLCRNPFLVCGALHCCMSCSVETLQKEHPFILWSTAGRVRLSLIILQSRGNLMTCATRTRKIVAVDRPDGADDSG